MHFTVHGECALMFVAFFTIRTLVQFSASSIRSRFAGAHRVDQRFHIEFWCFCCIIYAHLLWCVRIFVGCDAIVDRTTCFIWLGFTARAQLTSKRLRDGQLNRSKASAVDTFECLRLAVFVFNVVFKWYCRQIIDFACITLEWAVITVSRSGRVYAHVFFQAARLLKWFAAYLTHMHIGGWRCRCCCCCSGGRRRCHGWMMDTAVM